METSVNNKCRAFTSLEQSRKLAEILPLESADMYYPWYIEEDGDTIESGHRITTPNIGNFTTHKVNKMILPCWSLAALLEIIKKLIGYSLQSLDTHTVFMNCELGDKPYNIETKNYDNPVDTCYEMIIKLKELNLL